MFKNEQLNCESFNVPGSAGLVPFLQCGAGTGVQISNRLNEPRQGILASLYTNNGISPPTMIEEYIMNDT